MPSADKVTNYPRLKATSSSLYNRASYGSKTRYITWGRYPPSLLFSHQPLTNRVEESKGNKERMASKSSPDLKRYVEKRVSLKLNANRKVVGVLRGFDQFMNIVLEDAEEHGEERTKIGMIVIRGSAIQQMECLDAVS